MRQIWIIAKSSILENSRKQVFHVLCLLVLTVIVGSTLLSIFTEGVKLKILKDLCMTTILFGGTVLSIALGSTGIPNDIENRTIYPLIARPITRAQYVIGKFFGTFLTVAMGVAAMGLTFGFLIYSYQRTFDMFLPVALLFTLLVTAIIAAVATVISTMATPAVTAMLTFMFYLFGTVKRGYCAGLIGRDSNPVTSTAARLVYHLLPNLECFNLKTALVHQDTVPTFYMVQVAFYGVCYIAFLLFLGSTYFARKEV